MTVTVVTAMSIGHLLLSLSGSHDYLSPDDIRHGTAGPGLAVLVTLAPPAATASPCYAAFAGPGYRAAAGRLLDGSDRSGPIFAGAEMIL